jgi:hypothetical protein
MVCCSCKKLAGFYRGERKEKGKIEREKLGGARK